MINRLLRTQYEQSASGITAFIKTTHMHICRLCGQIMRFTERHYTSTVHIKSVYLVMGQPFSSALNTESMQERTNKQPFYKRKRRKDMYACRIYSKGTA